MNGKSENVWDVKMAFLKSNPETLASNINNARLYNKKSPRKFQDSKTEKGTKKYDTLRHGTKNMTRF